MSRQWGQQFSETRPIDPVAVEEKLLHCTTLHHDALRQLDFESLSAMLDHRTHSAPGPDGLPYACWSAAGERVRQVLFNVYDVEIANGAVVPAALSESNMVFIPKVVVLAGDMAYLAPPPRFRPPNLSHIAEKIVPKTLNATLEDAASILVPPVQRGFVKNRSLIGSILDDEFVMDSAVVIGAR